MAQSTDSKYNADQIANRIAKLLNQTVANGATEEEAMTAATMAQDLLEKYNLSMFDVEAATPKPKGRVSRTFKDLGKFGFRWRKDLAYALADYYYCAVLERGPRLTIIGTDENREGLIQVYDYLSEFIDALAKQHGKVYRSDPANPHMDPLRWVVSFSSGAVYRLRERLWENRQGQLQSNQNSQALIVLHQEAIDEFMVQTYPKLKTIKVKANQDITAWGHGFKAGNDVPLSSRTEIKAQA